MENIEETVRYLFPILLAIHYIENMPPVNNNSFTIFTGDLTSHDNDNQFSRAYVEYVESAIYSLFKAYLAGPVYAVIVRHFSTLLLCFSINILCRGTTTPGPKLSMHLTASNQRPFRTSLSGTTIIWHRK